MINETTARIRLLRSGLTQTEIAAALGITPQAVNRVLRGLSRSARIEALLKNPRRLRRAA